MHCVLLFGARGEKQLDIAAKQGIFLWIVNFFRFQIL